MRGVYLEKTVIDGETFWAAKDIKTNATIALADTPSNAIQTYETLMENEKIAKELGVSADDMDI